MTGPCPRCGEDPGFNWAVCPSCGNRDANAVPGTPPSPLGQSSPERWDKTILERDGLRAEPAARARFAGRGDFYTPVTSAPASPHPLRFDGAGGGDATELAGSGRTISRGDEPSDHTILERRGGGSRDEPDADHTVIMRGGRKGITGPLVYLIQRNGIRAGKVHLLANETDIGRGATNDIVLGDDTVSKRHAKIRVEDGKFVFWDLASANFSFLIGGDGKRTRILQPHPLSDQDTIELGEARLTFLEVERAEDA